MSFAYLDANSGSIIASAAAAGFAGAAVAAKLGWARVTGKLGRKGQPATDEGTEAPAEG
jgi:hypothetical protein